MEDKTRRTPAENVAFMLDYGKIQHLCKNGDTLHTELAGDEAAKGNDCSV